MKAKAPEFNGRKSKAAKKDKGSSSRAGTYVIDKRTGEIVKVSDRVPGISAHGASEAGSSADAGPCGRTECGGGSCMGGGFN